MIIIPINRTDRPRWQRCKYSQRSHGDKMEHAVYDTKTGQRHVMQSQGGAWELMQVLEGGIYV